MVWYSLSKRKQDLLTVLSFRMMDQLASIGVAFSEDTIETVFNATKSFYQKEKPGPTWADPVVYKEYNPVRPWGLGNIYASYTSFWQLAGSDNRTPGLYMRADPKTGTQSKSKDRMKNTNERVHSSVRTRIDLKGLDPDDKGPYSYPALKGNWEKKQIAINVTDPIKYDAGWGGSDVPPAKDPNAQPRWVWQYVGPKQLTPSEPIMIEDSLGPYERKLMAMNDRFSERIMPRL